MKEKEEEEKKEMKEEEEEEKKKKKKKKKEEEEEEEEKREMKEEEEEEDVDEEGEEDISWENFQAKILHGFRDVRIYQYHVTQFNQKDKRKRKLHKNLCTLSFTGYENSS
jgi:hypothetical protein